MLKMAAIKNLSLEELLTSKVSLKKKYYNIRVARSLKKAVDTSGLKHIRRDIARVMTEIRARELRSI